MTTPMDIIKLSMKDAGLISQGETPSDEDFNDALQKLNWMIAQWGQQRTTVYHLVEKEVVATGSKTYTVGPGAEIDVSVRPNLIDSAVYVLTPVGGYPTDVVMDVVRAYQDYQQIAVKDIVGPPRVVFLDTGWPTATLHVWPVPQAGQYRMKFLFKMVLTGFSDLFEDVNLPPEYMAALNWNLAKRLAAVSGEPGVNPLVVAEAANSLRLIRNTNNQVTRLRMPSSVPKRGYFDYVIGLWR